MEELYTKKYMGIMKHEMFDFELKIDQAIYIPNLIDVWNTSCIVSSALSI